MRKEYVEGGTRAEAVARCPWAAVVTQADGGWWCWESADEAEIWETQA